MLNLLAFDNPIGSRASWLSFMIDAAIRPYGGRIDSILRGESSLSFTPQIANMCLKGKHDVSFRKVVDIEPSADFLDFIERLTRPYDIIIHYGSWNTLFRALETLKKPTLSLEVSRFRFAPDFCFQAQTNDPKLETLLEAIRISENDLIALASRVKAFYSNVQAPLLFDKQEASVGLVIGQPKNPLVENGAPNRFVDFVDDIKAWCAPFDVLIYVPHPDPNRCELDLQELGTIIPGLHRTKMAIYQLLCFSDVKGALSLTSSVISEAPYFDVAGKLLVKTPRMVLASKNFDPISSAVFSPEFWRALVTGRTECEDFPRIPDMKKIVNTSRGFNYQMVPRDIALHHEESAPPEERSRAEESTPPMERSSRFAKTSALASLARKIKVRR